MKKIFYFLFLFLMFNLPAYSLEETDIKDFGLEKYKIVETNFNYTPLRTAPDTEAKRALHLDFGAILYADKETKNFYRIEVFDNNFLWLEKKYTKDLNTANERPKQEISSIFIDEGEDEIEIKIPLNYVSVYSFKEGKDGLKFRLFGTNFDPAVLEVENNSKNIELIKNENFLEINYKTRQIFAYDAKIKKDGLKISIQKPKINSSKKPLKDLKIAVDAGHGGSEYGVVAFCRKEKDVNLAISKKLKKELSKRGAKVYMTRRGDKFVKLYDRVDFAREKNSKILISIHQNSLPNPKNVIYKHGVGVYYYNESAKPLAKAILDELVLKTGFRNDGLNFASFALNRATSPVSVLVECGYLIDENEMKKLTQRRFQKKVAKAITKGVENYLKTFEQL